MYHLCCSVKSLVRTAKVITTFSVRETVFISMVNVGMQEPEYTEAELRQMEHAESTQHFDITLASIIQNGVHAQHVLLVYFLNAYILWSVDKLQLLYIYVTISWH